jgi:hypothetical protein
MKTDKLDKQLRKIRRKAEKAVVKLAFRSGANYFEMREKVSKSLSVPEQILNAVRAKKEADNV